MNIPQKKSLYENIILKKAIKNKNLITRGAFFIKK